MRGAREIGLSYVSSVPQITRVLRLPTYSSSGLRAEAMNEWSMLSLIRQIAKLKAVVG